MPNGMPHMCRTSSTHASPPTSSSKSKQFRRSQRTTPKVAAPPSTAATPRPWATCTPSATLSKNSRKRCSAPGSEARRTTPRCHTRPASVGYVARRPGDYSDAIDNKKLKVHMLLMESLGGIAPGGVAYLGKLAGLADPTAHGSRDSTTYTCWSAPTFMSHHGMCLSAAIVYADALILAEGARRLKISMAAT